VAKPKIAILETNGMVLQRFGPGLTKSGFELTSLKSTEPLSSESGRPRCDAILSSDPPPGTSAENLVRRAKAIDFDMPVVFIAETQSVRRAVEAIHCGAHEYLHISEDPILLVKIMQNALKVKSEPLVGKSPAGNPPVIITASPAMRLLLDMAGRIAHANATVLIQGESGTGKELFARYIHHCSGRKNHRFVAMNCAALPDNLAESELFGYERGAFTGAVQRKTGKFELADNGTLLLDEISEMPPALQAKLLRVLQEKEVDRVGGKDPVRINTRVIATTNRDLGQMVNNGEFRQDLYYRLRIIPLTIPPLRIRPEDIEPLADHFIRKYSTDAQRPPCFTAAAIDRLQRWHWPGNVRELENTVERAVLLSDRQEMGPEVLLLDEAVSSDMIEQSAQLVGLTVKEMEERLIVQTLKHVNENRTHAAQMLGISIRTLRNKLKEYKDGPEEWGQTVQSG